MKTNGDLSAVGQGVSAQGIAKLTPEDTGSQGLHLPRETLFLLWKSTGLSEPEEGHEGRLSSILGLTITKDKQAPLCVCWIHIRHLVNPPGRKGGPGLVEHEGSG